MVRQKNKIKSFFLGNPIIMLQFGLGVVFILAGIHRIVFFGMAYDNFRDLGLVPAAPLVVVTIILELAAGVSFIVNKFVKQSCVIIIFLLSIGITASILRAGKSLAENINELFLLTYTPTNIALHISYFIAIITILLFSLKDNK